MAGKTKNYTDEFKKQIVQLAKSGRSANSIAKEVLLMNKGEIIDSGAPHILCEKIDGKVFEITADESMLGEISAKYKVGNISKDEKNIYVRVISEQPPSFTCRTCKPDLEDRYLYYFD